MRRSSLVAAMSWINSSVWKWYIPGRSEHAGVLGKAITCGFWEYRELRREPGVRGGGISYSFCNFWHDVCRT